MQTRSTQPDRGAGRGSSNIRRSVFTLAAVMAMALCAITASAASAAVSFTAAQLTTAANPAAVAAGDVNGDGIPDLAIADTAANKVSVFLGNGDGTFKAKVDYTTGTAPSAVAIADVDGDGHPDLIVANSGSNNVSVLHGNGDGTFNAKVDFATGTAPSDVKVAKLVSGNSNPDIVVANQGSNSVSVLIGTGAGAFAAKVDYATGNAPTSVALGDLRHGGKLDIVTANSTANTVSVLLANGDGTFQAKTDLASANGPQSVTVADLAANNKPDIVVAAKTANQVSVLAGNGDGTFQAHADYTTGTSPAGIATSDLNGDGKLDVVTANSGTNTVSLLTGNGDGTLAAKQDFGVGNGPQAVAVADLNGDARPDIVAANGTDNTASVLLGSSKATADTTSPAAFPAQLYGTKSATQQITVTNNGSAVLTPTIAVSGNFTATGCSGTVLAGASCTLKIVFAPKGYGALSGSIKITAPQLASAKTISLSGTGIPPAPQATTTPATNNVNGYVALNATALSQGPATYYFQYGKTASYDDSTPQLTLASNAKLQVLSASVPVDPGATYHFRIVVTNLVGTAYGADQTFTEAPDSPAIKIAGSTPRLGDALKSGLLIHLGQTSQARVTIRLFVSRAVAAANHLLPRNSRGLTRVRVGRVTVTLRHGAARLVRVRFDKRAAKQLAGLRQLNLTISAIAVTGGLSNDPTDVRVTLNR